MAKIDDKQSGQMVSAYHADPQAFRSQYEIGDFLPPLASSVMKRLERGCGTYDELEYYECTKAGYEKAEAEVAAERLRLKPRRSRLIVAKESDNLLPF